MFVNDRPGKKRNLKFEMIVASVPLVPHHHMTKVYLNTVGKFTI
jgi:hypothetical protein